MPTVDEIRKLKEHYDMNVYQTVRTQQKTDDTYIMDTFPVPEIHEPHQIYRSGLGNKIVNAPAEHIVTSNPQVFFYPRKSTKQGQESALKLSELVNGHWLPILQRQNPNIFQEFIKNLLGRGEAYFKLGSNEGGKIPVNFIVPESMVVYGSPKEDVEGIPEKVVIWYSISQVEDLIPKHPELKDVLSSKKDKGETINWLEYYDAKTRYVEIAEATLTKGGVQANIFGFTPLVRKYSGFGKRSPDGDLASLIVSDIRWSRDLLREECATRSNIASVNYLFAHKAKTIIGEGLDEEQLRESIAFGAYDVNLLNVDPARIRIDELDIEPSAQMETHYNRIMNQLIQRHPFILPAPFGSSGRQDINSEIVNMRRYDSVVENCENAFATAIGMALKICRLAVLRPEGITPKDLETEYDIEVKLKAKDPLQEDRKITLGDRLWAGGKGSISLQTFHTQYQGMTQDESNREIARMLADQITIYNPDVAMVMGMVAAEETGMADWLEKARERRQMLEGQQGLRQPLPNTSQERIRGEVETPLGGEEAVPRGARQSPERYTRGG